jgi:SAP domain-containing ribonucleoprotein
MLISRQKLKVTELKELLSKHDLPQTGKKDDLVKRLLEANVAAPGEEELVSPSLSLNTYAELISDCT